MVALDDLGVLDALCESPALSLTDKRALAQVNTLTRAAVWRVLRSKLVHIHRSDRTVANVKFLMDKVLGDAADNDNFDTIFNVVNSTMTRHVSLPGYYCNHNYEHPQFSAFPLVNDDGPIDHTTAFFLGHLLARHAHYGYMHVNVRLTTGYEVDLMRMIQSDYFVQEIRQGLVAGALNRAALAGALLRNAKRRIKPDRLRLHRRMLRTVTGHADLSEMWLNNDHLIALGPKLRARAGLIADLDLKGNRFDSCGVVAVFDEPAGPPSDGPRWPILQRLRLDGTPMGVNGYPSLCRAIHIGQMPKLKELSLWDTALDSVGARLLIESLPHAPDLEKLNIGHNRIGLNGLAPLKRLPPSQIVLPKLTYLNVMFEAPYDMSKAGFRLLAQAILDNCFPKLDVVQTDGGEDAECVLYALSAIKKRREWFAAEKKAKKEMRKPGKRRRLEVDDDGGEHSIQE